jgi:uncharacterized repeat protein (TIGR01451 family)
MHNKQINEKLAISTESGANISSNTYFRRRQLRRGVMAALAVLAPMLLALLAFVALDVRTSRAATAGAQGISAPAFNLQPLPSQSVELTITKSSQVIAFSNTEITYTVRVTNSGPDTATNVTVSDTLLANQSFVRASPACTLTGNLVRCDVGMLSAFQSAEVTLTARTSANFPITGIGIITNTAQVTSTEWATRTVSTVATQVTRMTDMSIRKTGPLFALIGQSVMYTLTIRNNGPLTATGFVVADPTPAGLTFAGISGCTGTQLACTNLTSLAPGVTRTVNITFNIPSNYTPTQIITNAAGVIATSPITDINPLNNGDVAITLPGPVNNLVLTKTASSDTVARGENVTYTLELVNLGPSAAISPSVLDIMLPPLPFITGTTGACNFVPLLTGTIVLCDNLPVGSSYIITAVHAVPLDWVTPTVKNTGLAGSLNFDVDYLNNVSSSTITITSRADMSVTKEGPATVVPGTDAVFTLTAQNLGPSIATTVTVEDPGFNGLTPTVGAPCAAGFPCDLGTMWPQSMTQIVMTYSVPSSFTETEVINTASVTTGVEDPVEINNTSSVTVPVVIISNLDMTKEAPATVVPGVPITYTVIVTNNGPSDAAEVTLTDLDPISLTAAGNPCVAGVCSLPNLPAGMSTTLTLAFNIDPFARGTVTNTASVTSTGTPTPVVALALTELNPETNLTVQKTDGLKSAPFGTPLTYTIVVMNQGPSGVVNAIISDTMPAQLEYVAWSCDALAPNACTPGSGAGNIDAWVTLAPNTGVTITAMGVLTTSHPDTELSNTATITAPAGVTETDADDNTSIDLTNLVYVVDLAITKTVTPADSIAPGELFTYVVVVGNAGPSKAINAQVNDPLPGWMIDASWMCEAGTSASCSASSGFGNLYEETATLEPGSLVTFTITGTLSLDARGSIYNYAYVNPPYDVSDSNPNNNNAWVNTPIQSKAFIAIGKTNGQTIAVPGTAVTYVITLANNGPSNANGLVYDILPPELSNVQWMSDSINGAQVISDLNGITTPPGVQVDLPAGSAITLTAKASVNLTATGWLTQAVEFAIGNVSVNECGKFCECPSFVTNNPQFLCEQSISDEPLSPQPIINTNPITKAIDVDEIVPALVTGKIFNDLDGNGALDAGEPPLPSVSVVITGNGVPAVQVWLDSNGWFTLTVPPGPFNLSVVPASVPAGFVLTSNNDQNSGVAVAGSNFTGYIGYQGRGDVVGMAFNDINGNAEFDEGEAGLPNVVVSLSRLPAGMLQAAATASLTATTDATGFYSFTQVPASGYVMNASAPAGFVNTTPLPQNITVTPSLTTGVDHGFQIPGVLVISKAAQANGNGNLLGPDRLITYTLRITNTGGGLLNNALVTDTLESYLQYVDGSATPAPATTTPLVWELGNLQPGASVEIRFVTKVSAGFSGMAINTAIAGSAGLRVVQSNEVTINPAPTAISLVRFEAQRGPAGVTVMWQTGFERDTFGFNLFRSATGNRADAIQVNEALIAAGAKGGQYVFVDGAAEAGTRYTYWLQEIELSGVVNDYPDTAGVQGTTGQGVAAYQMFIPVLMR